jgi:sterol desaturase/sphingolipid hydroxylase (fatty acid hydroxylase superfamily)
MAAVREFLPILAYFVVRTIVVMTLAFALIRRTRFGRERRIFRVDIPKIQLDRELRSLFIVVPFYAFLLFLSMKLELIRYSEPSLAKHIFTFTLLVAWGEIWFYAFHRALHTPLLFRIHKKHHEAVVTDPMSFPLFTLTEYGLQVFLALALPALVSRHVPITFGGLTLYGIIQLLFNLAGHTNVEISPAGFPETAVGQVLQTPTFHALHHARSRGHYGLLTTIPDRLFRTTFEDYSRVHARAASGNGLVSTRGPFI